MGTQAHALKPLLLGVFLMLWGIAAWAQSAPQVAPQTSPQIATPQKQSLTLTQVVTIAVKRYPSIQRVGAEMVRSRHEITVAKTQYLPRVDQIYQQMQATQNVIPGTILPQFLNVIPIQSGQPHNSSTFASIFGTNAGLNFSWELIDFGKRAANVNVARSVLGSRTAQEKLTELDVASRAADSYLKLVMAQEQIQAYKATLERMKDWALVVHTLCDKGLKPGVDAARADAEVSLAKIELVEAERDAELAEQDLAESIGNAGIAIATVSEPLIRRGYPQNQSPNSHPPFPSSPAPGGTQPSLRGPITPTNPFTPPWANPKEANVGQETTFTVNPDLYKHPLAILRMSDVDVARARLHLLDRTWYPHLWYESAIWGRGSGDRQVIKPVAGGILPSTGNWAVGFTLQFQAMDYFKIRAQKQSERATIEAEKASYNLAMQELIKQDEKAKILLRRAREVADETPVLVKAAKENEIMARERYRVGLTNVIEVAQAERILARAQVADAVAQLKIWQAMLATAYAHGDLKPFLNLVASAESNR